MNGDKILLIRNQLREVFDVERQCSVDIEVLYYAALILCLGTPV